MGKIFSYQYKSATWEIMLYLQLGYESRWDDATPMMIRGRMKRKGEEKRKRRARTQPLEYRTREKNRQFVRIAYHAFSASINKTSSNQIPIRCVHVQRHEGEWRAISTQFPGWNITVEIWLPIRRLRMDRKERSRAQDAWHRGQGYSMAARSKDNYSSDEK